MPYYLLKYLSVHTVEQFYSLLLATVGFLILMIVSIVYMVGLRKARIVEQNTIELKNSFSALNTANEHGMLEEQRSKKVHVYLLGRSFLWYGLAALWFIDGLLQIQPPMASSMFVDMVLAPVLAGQPAFYLRMMGQGIQLWTDHQLLSAVFAAIIQLAIAVLLFVGKDKWLGKAGLWISIFWGLLVWIFGEGLGGILTGNPSFITGSPGSVTLYVVSAIFLLMPMKLWITGKMGRVERAFVSLFWFICALWQIVPSDGFWNANGISSLFENSISTPQPAILQVPIQSISSIATQAAVLWNGIFSFVMLLLAVIFWFKIAKRFTMILTFTWLLFTWWVGQDFGVVGGVGTDPNTSPIFALIIASLWVQDSVDIPAIFLWLKTFLAKVEKSLAPVVRRAPLLYSALATMMLIVSLHLYDIPAQGDTTLKNIEQYANQRDHFSNRGLTKKWMTIDARKKQVHILLIATQTALGDIDFDGYANGYMTIVVPVGWTVFVLFKNEQSLVYNSAMIVPFREIQAGAFTPAFKGASTVNPTVGIPYGQEQDFQFKAIHTGKYGVVSAVSDGQEDSGMWDGFDVSASAKSPYITAK
ncbi:sulfocyanin-like copper-binding protein [Sulfoacidibacillus ferrooxidans]|uniref:Sulfocyanin-like C-terminal domain-containing protein n=1 Tax=Sulfoacidibacillus ferrooxidans TaxID=2005001 RepID=A0A9X2ADB9_9BACL|nr:sulfocyanin-like copper-binding protein [Sulfoacidibacillus ferrooxidans]MCI0183235.1 hypothetical protein [Sulfoacidibacillus ferrooxidans]